MQYYKANHLYVFIPPPVVACQLKSGSVANTVPLILPVIYFNFLLLVVPVSVIEFKNRKYFYVVDVMYTNRVFYFLFVGKYLKTRRRHIYISSDILLISPSSHNFSIVRPRKGSLVGARATMQRTGPKRCLLSSPMGEEESSESHWLYFAMQLP